MGIAPGSLVDGRYRVEARVGAGGFGVVYAAFHLALERRVAIKVLRHEALGPLDSVARSEAIARFVTEGRTLTRLRHPNIVSALDFGTMSQGGEDGATGIPEPYLVLEWCEGETLASFVKRRGALSLDEACALFEPIVDGMAHAHASRVVHRDLKPSNVMVVRATDQAISPRIVDFGVAQIAEGEAAPSGDTRPEKRGGPHTPGYAAPEQIAAGRTGPWTDVHALGLLFVELVTGRPPFGDGEGDDLAIIDAARPTPRRQGVDVGPLEAVMVKALSLRPAARYADAGELLSAFREARGLPARSVVRLATDAREGATDPADPADAPGPPVEPGQTVTDEGVGGNVRGVATKPRRSRRQALRLAAILGVLGLAGLGARTALSGRAARGPTDPSDGKELCALTNEELRRRLTRAGATPTYASDYGALVQQQGNRSIYFAFGPEAILSGVHLASYPILSGEAWVANGRYARKLSPQNPAPAVYAARGSCTLTFTGHPTASPETVRRAFDDFRHGLVLDVFDEWPGKPATSLAALPAWELSQRAKDAGLIVDLDVSDDREGQMRFREPADAVLRMTSDAPTMMPVIRATASAYVEAGPKVVWVERVSSAEGAALLRRVLGPLAPYVIENTPPPPPPEVAAVPTREAFRAAPLERERKQGRLACEARLLAGYRRIVCRGAPPGKEILLEIIRGSFETLVEEPGEIGMMFRAEHEVRLGFALGKDKLVYDSAQGGTFAVPR